MRQRICINSNVVWVCCTTNENRRTRRGTTVELTKGAQSRLLLHAAQSRSHKQERGNFAVNWLAMIRYQIVAHLPQNKDTSTVIVTLSFDIRVCQQEDGQNDHYDIPTREDQPVMPSSVSYVHVSNVEQTYVNVSATAPILSGAYQAENATMAGIWSKQTCKA